MAGFRCARRLWFRKSGGRLSLRTSGSSRKFTESLKSRDSSANSRRIKINAMTCDLSRGISQLIQKRRPRTRNVFPASHGILAWAGARAVAERDDARIGEAAAD